MFRLDPIATSIIEELISDLQSRFTILIVTHSMQQAARVSQTAYFHLGKLLIWGYKRFSRGLVEQTDYISGKSGEPTMEEQQHVNTAFDQDLSALNAIRAWRFGHHAI